MIITLSNRNTALLAIFLFLFLFISVLFITGGSNDSSLNESNYNEQWEEEKNEEFRKNKSFNGNQNKLLLFLVNDEAKQFERRAILRDFYRSMLPDNADMYFVIGKPDMEYKKMIDAEQERFKDLFILKENDDRSDRKTLETLSKLPIRFGDRYQFVLRTYWESFVLLPSFASYLSTLNKTNVYGGIKMGLGSGDSLQLFNQDRGYFLSWDLVKWISSSSYAKETTNGYQDVNVGRWISKYGLDTKNWVDAPGYVSPNDKMGHNTLLVFPVRDSKTWIELAGDASRIGLLS